MVLLVLHESLDCYKIPKNIFRTQLVKEFEMRFYPYVSVQFCPTMEKTYYEIVSEKIKEIEVESSGNYFEDKKLLETQLNRTELLDLIKVTKDCKYTPNMFNIRKLNSYKCPKVVYPEGKENLHPIYKNILSGEYKKPLVLSEENKKEIIKNLCDNNFTKNTPRHNLCLKEEKILSPIKLVESYKNYNEKENNSSSSDDNTENSIVRHYFRSTNENDSVDTFLLSMSCLTFCIVIILATYSVISYKN